MYAAFHLLDGTQLWYRLPDNYNPQFVLLIATQSRPLFIVKPINTLTLGGDAASPEGAGGSDILAAGEADDTCMWAATEACYAKTTVTTRRAALALTTWVQSRVAQ
jgi:hypothetical protein